MRAELHVEHLPDPAPAAQIPTIPAELLANPADARYLPLVDRESSVEEWAMQQPLPEHATATALLEPPPEDAPLPPLPPAEIVQAVSVAAAYFEDTLSHPPPSLLAAGVTSALQLTTLLANTSLSGLQIRETVDAAMMPPGQGPTTGPNAIPRGWLAGVRGALRS